MAIDAFYQEDMARALPGQWGDTSAYNIEGACVLNKPDGSATEFVYVGVAVQHGGVDAMGDKLIIPMAEGGKAYGVAVRSHFQTTGKDGRMVYEPGGGINVMTHGRVWMLASAEYKPAFGTAIKLVAETGMVDATAAGVDTTWTATGDYTKFQDLYLVEVQVK